MKLRNKWDSLIKKHLIFTFSDIAIMGMMMSLYFISLFITKTFLPGKFNISIEIIFYIIFGIIFGPIKGGIFAITCDTFFQIFFGNIAFWMLEYAIIPPLVSISSWLLMFFYYKENKFKFIFPLVILLITIVGVIYFFVYQLINNSFKFENSVIDPRIVFWLMIILCILLISTIITVLTLYKIKKDKKYIKILYLISVIAIILIIFRWLWGPFAYVLFFNRFLATENNPIKILATQYPISLAGIAMKTTFVLPIFVIILIPIINVVSIGKKNYFSNRNYK